MRTISSSTIKYKILLAVLVVFLCAGIPTALADGLNIDRVSVSSEGTQGNNSSDLSCISADGRFVAFGSCASNLIADDTNDGYWDVFIRDRLTNMTSVVSISDSGTQGNNSCDTGSISGDGRYIAFNSLANNLVSNDTNGYVDVFVRDRRTNTTTLVSVSNNGTQGNKFSAGSSCSDDGRYVAFFSESTNLVPNDKNNCRDVFVRDRLLNTTIIVSVSDNGTQGNSTSDRPCISSDGRYIAFDSYATNLIPDDTNGQADVYVRDLIANTTTRISVASDGTQGNNISENPSISSDGRYIVFESRATNLVANDTNNCSDIFVRDRQTNTTTRVSVASDYLQANDESHNPNISGDGQFVVFESLATNLSPADVCGNRDIFVTDWQSDTTAWLGVTTDNGSCNANSYNPAISGDGHFISFESLVTNYVPDDTNNTWDIFVAENPFYEELSPDAPPPLPNPTPPSPHVSPALPPQLNQAQISLQYLSVNPQQAQVNQPLTITGNVVNTGDQAGNYNLALKINGTVEQTRMVSVGPRATQPIKFTVTKSKPGTYTVDIGSQRDSFTVLGNKPGQSSTSNNNVTILMAMGFLAIVAITIFLISRRSA